MDQIRPYAERAQKFLLDRIPQDRNSQILLGTGALSVAGVVLYPVLLHYTLGRQVSHTFPNASSRAASVECKEIDSFPSDLIEHPKQYRIVHDKVVKYLPNIVVSLSNKNEQNFNKILRRNLQTFSYTLSGFLIWYGVKTPSLRQSFDSKYIDSLDFKEGDVVCGIYEVVKRTPLRAEFKINPITAAGTVEGLLIVSVRPRNEGGVLSSESIQWTKKSSGAILPLERIFFWFLHSLTARFTTVAGAKYLQEISGRD